MDEAEGERNLTPFSEWKRWPIMGRLGEEI